MDVWGWISIFGAFGPKNMKIGINRVWKQIEKWLRSRWKRVHKALVNIIYHWKKFKNLGAETGFFVPNVFLGPKCGKNRSQSPKYMKNVQNHVNIQIALSICFLYLNSSYIHFRVLGTSNFFEIVEPYNSFQFISPVHFQRLFILFANSSYVYFRVLGDKAPNMEISPQTSKFWRKKVFFI